MDLPIHDEILWLACVKASRSLLSSNQLDGPSQDPRLAFPYLVRGSWMNDMNQVSPLLDRLGDPDVGPQQATLFQGLWKLELEDLLQQRVTRFPFSADLRQARASILSAPQNVDGFGEYDPFDHLDVPENKPLIEYEAWSSAARLGRASTANFTVTRHVPNRLVTACVSDRTDRLTPQRLTIFGRALHTLADFFAHSNYVELLLWSLAWRNRLDSGILEAFNHDDGSVDAGHALFRCPLPPRGPRAGDTLRKAVLWYGASPEETPFVSALFDSKDTIYSLLHIYTAHLVRTDGKDQTEPALDLAMAVFDIQGAPLIKGAWELLDSVADVFRGIGQAARNFLATGIANAAVGRDPTTRDLMETAAHLVRRYDSKEANEWARAGKIKFLARELQLQMAGELDAQSAGRMLLPHHSLLAKDHVGDEAGGQLRFKLACLLATEVTAKVIEWYFSPGAPNLDVYRALSGSVLIHPWRLLEATPNFDQRLGERVRAADGSARWQHLSLDGLELLEGAL